MINKAKYVFLGIFLASLSLWGLAVTVPNSFNSGDVVSAAKINANFNALKTAIASLETEVANLNSKVSSLESENEALRAKLARVADGQYALPSRDGVLGYYEALTDGGPMGDSEYYNSSGGQITGEYDDTEMIYTITFEGLGRSASDSDYPGIFLVTAEGSAIYKKTCKSELSSDGGNNAVAKVVCYNLETGEKVTSTFAVMYIR